MAKIIFYRILGNDLPPRHSASQTITNLKFILEKEPELSNCEKRFLLNRIADRKTMRNITAMLNDSGYRCDELPFRSNEYISKKTHNDKFHYLTNINPARNHALKMGLEDGKICLPFDGQTFFTMDAWKSFLSDIQSHPDAACYVVPMYRLNNNESIFSRVDNKRDEMHGASEPQAALTQKSDLRFNEKLGYGQGNKIELLMRLGVNGPWDNWNSQFFQMMRRQALSHKSISFGNIPSAGYVFRLFSGNALAEKNISRRARDREVGIKLLIDKLNKSVKKGDGGIYGI